MIDSFLTIVIPCNNSIPGIVEALEDIIKQTKIRGTRILIIDKGSEDGTVQFVSQFSTSTNKVNVEVIDSSKDDVDLYSLIRTPFFIYLNEITKIKDVDFLINTINLRSVSKKNIVYISKKDSFIKKIFPRHFLGNMGIHPKIILSDKSFIYDTHNGTPIDKIFTNKNFLKSCRIEEI